MRKIIVVCDDDPKAREKLCSILTKQGFIVVPCCKKDEALRMIKAMKPVACFLDISLNGSLGKEGIEMAKEIGKGPAVFLMSLYPDTYSKELVDLFQRQLIQGIIRKPHQAALISLLLKKV